MFQKQRQRAALYIRVSTQGQADNGVSLDFQLEKLLDYAKKEEMTVQDTHIYKDE